MKNIGYHKAQVSYDLWWNILLRVRVVYRDECGKEFDAINSSVCMIIQIRCMQVKGEKTEYFWNYKKKQKKSSVFSVGQLKCQKNK